MPAETAAVAAERAAYLAAPQWVVFSCDGHWLAFPIARVREILPPRGFTRLPGCGPEVCGLVGLRGRIVTVLDFGAILGLRPAAGREDHRLVLVEHDGRVVGMAVDEMVAVTRAAARDMSLRKQERRIFDIERDEVIGVGSLDGRPFTAIDPDPVIRRMLD
jgi:purine-binding chemotaxis protein CheW